MKVQICMFFLGKHVHLSFCLPSAQRMVLKTHFHSALAMLRWGCLCKCGCIVWGCFQCACSEPAEVHAKGCHRVWIGYVLPFSLQTTSTLACSRLYFVCVSCSCDTKIQPLIKPGEILPQMTCLFP